MGEIKNLVSLSSSVAHITLMCDRGTIYSILHATSECQTMPWKHPLKSVCKTQTGGVSLGQISLGILPEKRLLHFLGEEYNFLVARSQAKMENRSGRGRT